MTFQEQYDATTSYDAKLKLVKRLMHSLINKYNLKYIDFNLIDYFSHLYVENRLIDSNGEPIRNIKAFLTKINEHKMPTKEWYEQYYIKNYEGKQ